MSLSLDGSLEEGEVRDDNLPLNEDKEGLVGKLKVEEDLKGQRQNIGNNKVNTGQNNSIKKKRKKRKKNNNKAQYNFPQP